MSAMMMMMMAAANNSTTAGSLCQIKDLVPHRNGFVLIDALVIAKSPLRWIGVAAEKPSSSSATVVEQQQKLPSFFMNDSASRAAKKSESRCVFNCTLRDSVSDFVNLSIWSQHEDFWQSFHIGDIIRIGGAKVVSKKFSGDDDKFAPLTPALIELTLSSGGGSGGMMSSSSSSSSSFIRLLGSAVQQGSNRHPLADLMFQPIRDASDYFALSQVIRMGRRLENDFVNLLAVVKSIGKERHMKSRKDGHDIVICDVHVLDASCTDFVVTLWDSELINFAKNYLQRNQVVFFVDVIVKFDEKFRRGCYASSNVRTVLIPNPRIPDAERLYRLVADDIADVFNNNNNNNQSNQNENTENDIEIAQISDQFIVDQIRRAYSFCMTKTAEIVQQRASSALTLLCPGDAASSSLQSMTIVGYLVGYLLRVPIGGDLGHFARLACGNCGHFLDNNENVVRQRGEQDGEQEAEAEEEVGKNHYNNQASFTAAAAAIRYCPDARCRVAFYADADDNDANNNNGCGGGVAEMVWRYRMSIDVADDSGTLRWLQLSDRVARKLLGGIEANELVRMDVSERCSLKWRLLFEKYKIYFKIQPSQVSGKLSINVLELALANPLEMCGLTSGGMLAANSSNRNHRN